MQEKKNIQTLRWSRAVVRGFFAQTFHAIIWPGLRGRAKGLKRCKREVFPTAGRLFREMKLVGSEIASAGKAKRVEPGR